jgi:PLP dependent protein
MNQIKTIAKIQDEIKKISPHPEKVRLLAVSKKQPVSKIQDIINQKHFLFGENYVQEALEKMDLFPKNIEWHLIGHLQSKKVNSIIGKFACIHSIDSLKLAELIGQKSQAAGLTQNIFVEINLGNEETKTGFSTEEIRAQWSAISTIEGLRIAGLMALPPSSEDENQTRLHFRNLKQLLHELRNNTDTSKHPMDDLSMGTSQDYSIALQEGSTLIRVGTILFGERV